MEDLVAGSFLQDPGVHTLQNSAPYTNPCLLVKKGKFSGSTPLNLPSTKPPLLNKKAEFSGGPTKAFLLVKKGKFSGPRPLNLPF